MQTGFILIQHPSQRKSHLQRRRNFLNSLLYTHFCGWSKPFANLSKTMATKKSPSRTWFNKLIPVERKNCFSFGGKGAKTYLKNILQNLFMCNSECYHSILKYNPLEIDFTANRERMSTVLVLHFTCKLRIAQNRKKLHTNIFKTMCLQFTASTKGHHVNWMHNLFNFKSNAFIYQSIDASLCGYHCCLFLHYCWNDSFFSFCIVYGISDANKILNIFHCIIEIFPF